MEEFYSKEEETTEKKDVLEIQIQFYKDALASLKVKNNFYLKTKRKLVALQLQKIENKINN